MESVIKEDMGKKGGDLETVGQEDLFKTVGKEDFETVWKEYSAPPNPLAPPRISQQKIGPPSCYVGTRSQEQEKANSVAVRSSTKGY